LTDSAPQFKKLTLEHALCWIHDGRHYNRLGPIVPLNVEILNNFKTCFWDYYGELLKYKENPTPEKAELLSAEFDRISQENSMPSLADLIIQNFLPQIE
jgi:hypothetical protein